MGRMNNVPLSSCWNNGGFTQKNIFDRIEAVEPEYNGDPGESKIRKFSKFSL